MDSEELYKLNLSAINKSEEISFKKLYKLDLSNNEISEIDIFEKINFEKLYILDLGDNEIKIEENNPIIINLKSKIKNLMI